MKEKKLFVKMFIVLASFFVLFILSNSQVFAAESKDLKFELKSGKKVVLHDKYSRFSYDGFLLIPFDSGYALVNYDSSKVFVAIDSSTSICQAFWLDGSSDAIDGAKPSFCSARFDLEGNQISGFSISNSCYTVGVDVAIDVSDFYANKPVYDLKNLKDTVFSPAKETILVPIAKSMDFLAVIKEILEILPMILVVLIGLLGLMKAIRLMLKMLHQA